MLAQKTRLVITGYNENHRSIVASDNDAAHVHVFEDKGGLTVTDLWMTSSTPADNLANDELVGREFSKPSPPNGSVFRVIDYPPDEIRFANTNREVTSARLKKASQHPGMHKTDTIDYAVILSGEMYAIMDEGEVLLKAGDCLVQRGTNHAWSNRTNNNCRIAFVMIGAKPV